jgi:translation elongation factor EF-4
VDHWLLFNRCCHIIVLEQNAVNECIVVYFRPVSDVKKPLKCLMFDSWYTPYRGAVASIAVLDGVVRKGNMCKLFVDVLSINHNLQNFLNFHF